VAGLTADVGVRLGALDLDVALHAGTEEVVAVVRATGDRAGAEGFVERLLGPAGRSALVAHGFELP
jgi:hypothetical protein